ncbi:nitrate reductase subunit beta [Salmonella enterica subsp. enterica serovar Cerro]|nr:nitrate reductase subunit beta [Salmonella enterica subsp. enterica serovar Cerro]
MEWIADPSIWAGLVTLIVIELVLGIDNLVFIAILAEKLPPGQRDRARITGLILAMIMRLLLLASISWLVTLTKPLFSIQALSFSARDLIMLFGGFFLLFKATMELNERLEGKDSANPTQRKGAKFWAVVAQIVVLDAIFSLDSVITAVGMVDHLAKIRPRLGGKMGVISKIFANPVIPQIDDYYEPFTFDYQHLHTAPESKHQPTARPRSLIDGKRMDKVIWGPNWEELLGGEFEKRARDRNFDNIQKEMYGQFENTFMMYLPRLCEHCLNPSCVATCPSGAIYKREEDGIVLIDQDKCRGWRLCISGCPYKKIYFNWKSGKSEKCIFCYPRIESGQPTVCSETCVGRIRYLGVLLYDADRIEEAASTEHETDLYERQCDVFLNPHDPAVIEEALKQGIPQNVIDAAQRSPVYKMAMDWKLALPLHPEYRTLPMVWYVPPLSPIQSYADAGGLPHNGNILPAVETLRIPVQYLANMLSAGDTGPVIRALKRMMAMRHYMRSQTVEGVTDTRAIDEVGLSVQQVEEMYRYLAIANYEDRFVIPTSHREMARDAFPERNGCGFTFGDGCHGSDTKFNLFNSSRIDAINITEVRDKAEGE